MVKDCVKEAIAQMENGAVELEPWNMLQEKSLDDEDASAIAKALKDNNTLKEIKLYGNYIGAAAASEIYEGDKVITGLAVC